MQPKQTIPAAYQPPEIINLQEIQSGNGECTANGSGDSGSCVENGNSAGDQCGEGNVAINCSTVGSDPI